MDNVSDTIILLHEASLVLPDKSSENKLKWCYDQCEKKYNSW
jgi:hypothetical protein